MVRRENRRRLVVGLVKHPQKRNTPRSHERGVFLVFGERFANGVGDPEVGAKLEGYFCDGLPHLPDSVVIEEIPGFLGDRSYGFVLVEVPSENDEAGESAVVCEVDVFEVGHVGILAVSWVKASEAHWGTTELPSAWRDWVRRVSVSVTQPSG